jgi:hypothetical protein
MNPVRTIRSQNSKLVRVFVCSNAPSAKARSPTNPDTVASQIRPPVGGLEGAATSAAYHVTADVTADVIADVIADVTADATADATARVTADATARVTAPREHRNAHAVSRCVAAQEIA